MLALALAAAAAAAAAAAMGTRTQPALVVVISEYDAIKPACGGRERLLLLLQKLVGPRRSHWYRWHRVAVTAILQQQQMWAGIELAPNRCCDCCPMLHGLIGLPLPLAGAFVATHHPQQLAQSLWHCLAHLNPTAAAESTSLRPK